MGVLFNRGGTGLTEDGNPMTDQELALLLSSMGGGGGLTGAAKSLFARLAMKNKANARSRISGEAIDSLKTEQPAATMMRPQGGPMQGGNRAPGGGFSLGLGQGGENEMAKLMAMMSAGGPRGGGMSPGGMPPRGMAPQGQPPRGMPPRGMPPGGGGAAPPPQAGMVGPMMSGSPGGAAPPAPFVQAGALQGPGVAGSPMPLAKPPGMTMPNTPTSQRSSQASLQGNPAQQVSKFYETTPKKLDTIKKMIASGDQALRAIGKSWMTAVISGPKPKDRYMAVGGSLYDVYTQQWITPKKPPGLDVTHLQSGINIVEVTDGQGNTRTTTMVVPQDSDWQIKEVSHSIDTDSGEEINKLVRVDTETGLTQDLYYPDGGTVISGTNVSVNAEKVPSGAMSKWWDQYSAASLSLKQLKSLEPVKEAIMSALTVGGKIELAWGNIISSLGIDPGPEFAEMTTGLAKAQHVANLYIKTITGAQMSEREASRLLKAIPSPRDNPAQWLAKLDAAIELADMAMKHYEELIEVYGKHNLAQARKEAHAYSEKLVDDFIEKAEQEKGFGGGVHIVPATE